MVRAMQHRMFWYNLSRLVNAGLKPLRALHIIASQLSDSDKFDLGIKQMIHEMENVDSIVARDSKVIFSEAVNNSKLFSYVEMNIVRAGDVGGIMPIVLERLANGQISTRADQYQGFYRNLSTFMLSGIPILQGLKLSSQFLDEPFQAVIDGIAVAVQDQCDMSVAMSVSGAFSAFEVNLIDVGEECSCVDGMLLQLADLSRPIKFC